MLVVNKGNTADSRVKHAVLPYAGNGYAIEWKGFAYGCVRTKVAGRGWTHWYKLPFINYGDTDTTVPAPVEDETTYTLGSRLLKKGCNGADVTALQQALLKLGYKLPKYGADGDYGSETIAAVTAFQQNEGLEQDGSYGDKTHAAMMDGHGQQSAGFAVRQGVRRHSADGGRYGKAERAGSAESAIQ